MSEHTLHVVDFSAAPGAAEFRQKMDRDRAESRRRYFHHLASAFAQHPAADPFELADIALNTLTPRRAAGSSEGELCACGCHPQLPSTDLHDFGFDCPCSRTPEQRRDAFEEFRESQRQFWASPSGRQIVEAEEAEEDTLAEWLAGQSGVTVAEHGGRCPEQWSGEVDGHSFYFRERHDEWRIELDLRPTGRFVNAVSSVGPAGKAKTIPREIDEGDVIAVGTVDTAGYGKSLVERAQFLISTIRNHLGRVSCRLHSGDLSAVEAALGAPVRWCPACGTDLELQAGA
jgi:hypothetical protein